MTLVKILRELVKTGAATVSKENNETIIKHHKYSNGMGYKNPALARGLVDALAPYYVGTNRPHGWYGEVIRIYKRNGKVIKVVYGG